ncbi:MAG: metal ABC transporter permease [Proteobacteria bacterium]|nr:metal ABC transporter permease [Pseudomonadota bacterium]MBU1057185.1 metal ABC transporter permease [Pseudomonadota bacterium]
MSELWSVLFDPNICFFRYALLTGIFASLPFGIIGTLVVVRRISYIAGAISHCVLGGIGLGLYLEKAVGVSWFGPLQGAVVASLLAAVVLALVSRHARQREDSVIGALWAVGMATGLLFIAKTPGYVDPMSYLFGNILLVSKSDFIFVLILDVVVLGLVGVFYHKFLAICFDEEFSRLRGLRTGWLYLLLLCLTALTIVLLVRVVGIVMVIALLTLPAAVAGNFSSNILQMMLLAVLFCAGFVVAGLGVSFTLDLPSGPIIIVIAAMVYLLILVGGKVAKVFKK